MAELSWPLVAGLIVLCVGVAVVFMRGTPNAKWKHCPKCSRRVPYGRAMCSACGATVNP